MRKVAVWLEGRQDVDALAFMFFLLAANTVQGSVQFYFPDPPDALVYDDAEALMLSGEDVYGTSYDAHLFITSAPIKGNLFWSAFGLLARVTTAGW